MGKAQIDFSVGEFGFTAFTSMRRLCEALTNVSRAIIRQADAIDWKITSNEQLIDMASSVRALGVTWETECQTEDALEYFFDVELSDEPTETWIHVSQYAKRHKDFVHVFSCGPVSDVIALISVLLQDTEYTLPRIRNREDDLDRFNAEADAAQLAYEKRLLASPSANEMPRKLSMIQRVQLFEDDDYRMQLIDTAKLCKHATQDVSGDDGNQSNANANGRSTEDTDRNTGPAEATLPTPPSGSP